MSTSMRVTTLREPVGRSQAARAARISLSTAVVRRDWTLAETTLLRYGHYLELVGGGTRVGERRVFDSVRVNR